MAEFFARKRVKLQFMPEDVYAGHELVGAWHELVGSEVVVVKDTPNQPVQREPSPVVDDGPAEGHEAPRRMIRAFSRSKGAEDDIVWNGKLRPVRLNLLGRAARRPLFGLYALHGFIHKWVITRERLRVLGWRGHAGSPRSRDRTPHSRKLRGCLSGALRSRAPR